MPRNGRIQTDPQVDPHIVITAVAIEHASVLAQVFLKIAALHPDDSSASR